MEDTPQLAVLMVAIAEQNYSAAAELLAAHPALATARLARHEEGFIEARRAQIYEGDTALHAAAFSYDTATARELLSLGAAIGARNRRGAEPLHAAMMGAPDTDTWDPTRQCEVIRFLIEAGADPNAPAKGGVTPLHRAVRNRCSAAVEVLLALGADPRLKNDSGSTASDLAGWTTGRGGTGSENAKAEQRIIVDLLARS